MRHSKRRRLGVSLDTHGKRDYNKGALKRNPPKMSQQTIIKLIGSEHADVLREIMAEVRQ